MWWGEGLVVASVGAGGWEEVVAVGVAVLSGFGGVGTGEAVSQSVLVGATRLGGKVSGSGPWHCLLALFGVGAGGVVSPLKGEALLGRLEGRPRSRYWRGSLAVKRGSLWGEVNGTAQSTCARCLKSPWRGSLRGVFSSLLRRARVIRTPC